MPATIILTKHPIEHERRERGYGGKPPADHRYTGGGGNGDEDWHPKPSTHRTLLKRIRLFLIFALASDLSFFFAIVLSSLIRITMPHVDSASRSLSDWPPILLPRVLYLSTAALMLSCVSVEVARRKIFCEIDVMDEWLGLGQPALQSALPWLVTTLALGLLFLVGQWVAWGQLIARGLTVQRHETLAGSFFYLILGGHALHLLVGVVALILCVTTLSFLRRVELRQIAIDVTGWYWHTMSAAWVLLFSLLIFAQ